MKVIEGYLTAQNKKAIKAMFEAGVMEAKVGIINYFISEENGVYTVAVKKMDRGLISCGGSELRLSTYRSKFTL